MTSPLTSLPAIDSGGEPEALFSYSVLKMSTPGMKPCAGCRLPNLHEKSNYKNCPGCRKKNAEKKRRQQQRAEAARGLQEIDANIVILNSATGERVSVKKEKKRELDSSSRPIEKIKEQRKERVVSASPLVAGKPLKDLEKDSEELRLAMRMMKERVKKRAAKQNAAEFVKNVQSHESHGTEYQDWNSLQAALKAAVLKGSESSKRVRFRGFHSAVQLDTNNHQKRAEMVAGDIRKAGVLFEHPKPVARDTSPEETTVIYLCACKGYKTVQPEAPSTTPAPTVKKSSLLAWARKFKKHEETQVRIECHGAIVVTVEKDDSHPHGLPGERVHIAIEHSKNTTSV